MHYYAGTEVMNTDGGSITSLGRNLSLFFPFLSLKSTHYFLESSYLMGVFKFFPHYLYISRGESNTFFNSTGFIFCLKQSQLRGNFTYHAKLSIDPLIVNKSLKNDSEI